MLNEAIKNNPGVSISFIRNITSNIEKYKQANHNYYEIDDQLDKIEAFEDTIPYKEKIEIAQTILKQLFDVYKNVIDLDDIIYKLSLYKENNKESKYIGVSTNQNVKVIDDIEDHFIKQNIHKREIINALSTGFATKIQKDIALNMDIEKIPMSIISTYLKLLKLEDIEMINVSDDSRLSTEAVSYSEISYNDNLGKYVVTANADNIISLVFEAVLGTYEVIAMSYQENLDAEALEKIQKHTDTVNAEKDSFKYGYDMVIKFEEMFFEIENILIKKGLINDHNEENMLTFLSYFYTLKEDIFLQICENIFSDDSLNDYSIKILSNIYKKTLQND